MGKHTMHPDGVIPWFSSHDYMNKHNEGWRRFKTVGTGVFDGFGGLFRLFREFLNNLFPVGVEELV